MRICALALTLPMLTGCANYIFNRFDIDGSNDSLSIDAKQRVILSTREGGTSRDRKIVCAEPSPDALSAMSAAGSASGAITAPQLIPGASGQQATQGQPGGGGFGLAGASSEAVASLAMRTQTVQLLRDGYYRLCEAFMNGAIDQNQYNIVLVNIDRLMVTLMGVDGIAGTRNVAPVTISPNTPRVASSAVARALEKTSATPDEKARAVAEAQADVAAAQGFREIGSETVVPAGSAQAEAIANIVLAANSSTAFPALCISLLSSGGMRLDNPGQHSVLKHCDYLLNGITRLYAAKGGPRPHPPYTVSKEASESQKNIRYKLLKADKDLNITEIPLPQQ
jgi:hypothetical protein